MDQAEYIINAQNLSFNRLSVDHAAAVEFSDTAAQLTLRLECPFTLVIEGVRYDFIPSGELAEVKQLLSVLGKPLSSIKARDYALLIAEFADGSYIQVDPRSDYEWFNLFYGKSQVHGMPRGQIAVFD